MTQFEALQIILDDAISMQRKVWTDNWMFGSVTIGEEVSFTHTKETVTGITPEVIDKFEKFLQGAYDFVGVYG